MSKTHQGDNGVLDIFYEINLSVSSTNRKLYAKSRDKFVSLFHVLLF